MENLSIGIDIEEIERFSKYPIKENRSLYDKLFTPSEINYCLTKANPYMHFTARFCAKEAAIKAIDDRKISLQDIEIKIEKNKPKIILPLGLKGNVSMSHTKNIAIATVIIF